MPWLALRGNIYIYTYIYIHIYVFSFWTSTLDGSEWWTSRPGGFTRGKYPVTDWTGDWLRPIAELDFMQKIPLSLPGFVRFSSQPGHYTDDANPTPVESILSWTKLLLNIAWCIFLFYRSSEELWFCLVFWSREACTKKWKSAVPSGNACHPSLQNILHSHLLSENINFKLYKIVILLVLCVCVCVCVRACEIRSVTSEEEGSRGCPKTGCCGPKIQEMTGGWKKYCVNGSLMICNPRQIILGSSN
jgi:hypothetical protein